MPVGHTVVGQFSVHFGQTPPGFGLVMNTTPFAIFVPTVPDVPTAHTEKFEKFNRSKFKRWQQKMMFYLTTLHLDRYFKEEVPSLTAESNVQVVYDANVWKHAN